jgi:hypothetical protein
MGQAGLQYRTERERDPLERAPVGREFWPEGDPMKYRVCRQCQKRHPMTSFRQNGGRTSRRWTCYQCERKNARERAAASIRSQTKDPDLIHGKSKRERFVRSRTREILNERGIDPMTVSVDDLFEITHQIRREWFALTGETIQAASRWKD